MVLRVRPTPTGLPTNILYIPWGKLFLLLRHSTKSLIAQQERLATSPQLVTRLHLPHARLHVVILTPEAAGTVGV